MAALSIRNILPFLGLSPEPPAPTPVVRNIHIV